ncbi:MAG: hypothetical protein AAGB22_15170, partial [Bacteroidota bacterium]
ANGHYLLDLIPENELVEIDQVILDKGKDLVLPPAELAGSCANPGVSLEAAFSWGSNCQEETQFTAVVSPSFDLSCNSGVVNYTWQHVFTTTAGGPTTTHTYGPGSAGIALTGTASGTLAAPVLTLGLTNDVQLTVSIAGGPSVVVAHNNITGLPKPTVVATSDATNNQLCEGQEAQLTATASGGTAPYAYAWYPTLTTLQSDQAVTTVLPNQADPNSDYEVTVTDANGCTASGVVTLNVTAPLSVEITSSKANPVCHGYNQAVNLTSAVSGGTGPYTYSWSPSGDLSVTNVANPTLLNANGLQQNLYALDVTDANGCPGRDETMILVLDTMQATIATSPVSTIDLCPSVTMVDMTGSHN